MRYKTTNEEDSEAAHVLGRTEEDCRASSVRGVSISNWAFLMSFVSRGFTDLSPIPESLRWGVKLTAFIRRS